jgi:IS1 family transposase
MRRGFDPSPGAAGEHRFSLWTAQCRRTRQIVAHAVGDRSQDTGRELWQAVPLAYRGCTLYTDHWEAYTLCLPPHQHLPSGKSSGLTTHQERWYNTLVAHWFLLEHNLRIQASLTL